MSKKQETIADIVRWLRGKPVVFGFRETNNLADRIEAAWKREKDECEAAATSKMHEGAIIIDNRRCGNAAAMREALKAVVAVGYPHNFQREAPHIRGYCYDITKAIEKCFAALSAPPRNCDVGTAEEQFERWQAFCDKYDDDCTGCPCDGCSHTLTNCFSNWAQMPHEKGGAK